MPKKSKGSKRTHLKQAWETSDVFSPSYTKEKSTSKSKSSKKDRSARKIQRATRSRLSKKKKAVTKIQSRLRGNMTRRKEDIPWTEPLLSVPYRDTDWKNVEGLEFPWEAEKKILKSIIHPEGIDDITE